MSYSYIFYVFYIISLDSCSDFPTEPSGTGVGVTGESVPLASSHDSEKVMHCLVGYRCICYVFTIIINVYKLSIVTKTNFVSYKSKILMGILRKNAG